MAAIHSLVDRITAAFSAGEGQIEALRAREAYFEQAGKVFDDDGDLYEGRIASFLEWYAIERPFRGGPPPAARVAAGENGDGSDGAVFSREDRLAAVHLATSHLGLFEIERKEERRLALVDLIGGARFEVHERRSTAGFEPGALFEGRLMWDGEHIVFGRTFLFHPPDAREAVLKLADAAVAAGTPAIELLFRLSRLHVRWHRLGHVAAAKIYAEKAG